MRLDCAFRAELVGCISRRRVSLLSGGAVGEELGRCVGFEWGVGRDCNACRGGEAKEAGRQKE